MENPIIQSEGVTPEPVDQNFTTDADLTILSCSTGNAGCAGVATFHNGANQTASYTVWFQNGAQGRSNFVLGPGQRHGIHVRTGDTWSSVWGSTVVPDHIARSWIWVG